MTNENHKIYEMTNKLYYANFCLKLYYRYEQIITYKNKKNIVLLKYCFEQIAILSYKKKK